ncbi:MAG: lipoprotein-releasing ABC transporter permease subunit [Steroidobacteraceae bacterium]|jgi:lipoprotein-releasing system permease protein|nr:lipoprotein-releasing ABC transporter permease subunit [Steroidobacteraceae bacterium]
MSESRLPWTWWIGARYLRLRRDDRFVGFISAISMLGIALGVAVLVVVLSVMNGFERTLRERILDVAGHATLEGLEGRLEDWRGLQEQTGAAPGVVAVAPYVEGRGMLVAGPRSAGVQLRGIDPGQEGAVSALARQAGGVPALREGGFGIVLGRVLAEQLGVAPGDRVLLVIAQGNVTPAGVVPRMRRFTVEGVFEAGMYEYDRGLALLHLSDAQRLFRLGGDVTGLRYAIEQPYAAPGFIRGLAVELGGGFYISDWTRRNGNFFRSIQVTRTIMMVVLLLVVAVAAFNIVSTLVMVVKQKREDIAILRTLGSTPREILSVFVAQGTAIGLVGTLAGVALGLAIAFNLTAIVQALEGGLGVTLVDARVYYIDELPADVRAGEVMRVALTALALGVLSTLYPAWRAARAAPAEALRSEV